MAAVGNGENFGGLLSRLNKRVAYHSGIGGVRSVVRSRRDGAIKNSIKGPAPMGFCVFLGVRTLLFVVLPIELGKAPGRGVWGCG